VLRSLERRSQQLIFSDSALWHVLWSETELGLIKLEGATWKPLENTETAFSPARRNNRHITYLLRNILDDVPRDQRPLWMNMLECHLRGDTPESCDLGGTTQQEVQKLQRMSEQPSVSNADYEKSLAGQLWWLVCRNGADTVHILRGLIGVAPVAYASVIPGGGSASHTRLAATGHKAPALVDSIMSKDCPVSAALTGDDKAKLLEIKQSSEQDSAPSPASKKAK
jgi:hypothetical protein